MDKKAFVYGTLRQGEHNYHLIERYVKSITPASAAGVMYDLGTYPAVVEGPGAITGEIIEFTDIDAAFEAMDELEDYKEDSTDNEYIRITITATAINGDAHTCKMYVYPIHRKKELERSFTRIESGDWLKRQMRFE